MKTALRRFQRRAVLHASALALGLAAGVALAPAPALAQPTPEAIQAALRGQRIQEREIRDFYAARNFRPLWVRDGTLGPEADALLRLIQTGHIEGLNPRDYRPNELAEEIDEGREGRARRLARAELLLSRRFIQYVREVRDPNRIGRGDMIFAESSLAPRQPSARAVLDTAAAAPSLAGYIESIGWMHPIYARLRSALFQRPRGLIFIPSGPMLREGSTGERVHLLRRRLGLAPEGPFDAGVASAVRDFQIASELPVDAIVGAMTLGALNRSSESSFTPEQERLIRVNLARARGLPADPPRRYILVDAAAARLWTYENGRVRDTMSVVVGRETDQTPMIAGMIRTAVLNPYWNVPPDLAAERIAPRVLAEGQPYLRSRRYQVMSDWSDTARVLDARRVDWAAVAAGRREVRIRQLPGPDNSMGRMKFEFPNELGVYLHDTPERDLLREAARQRSAGCVRVEDASRLATWMFGRSMRATGSRPEQRVELPDPVPVYITYLTAAPEGDRIAFRADSYNRDRAAMAALEAPARPARNAERRARRR